MKTTEDWDSYRYFLACQTHGSLRGAAKAMGVNHATVARAVESLEHRLGGKVFHRNVGGLQLSEIGHLLLKHVVEIDQQVSHIQRLAAGADVDPAGVLRVSLPPSLAQGIIAPELAGFARAFPRIDVHLLTTNRVSNLLRSEADVSLRVARNVLDDVVGRKLVRYVTTAYVSEEYLRDHPDLATRKGQGAQWIGWGGDKGWARSTPFPEAEVRGNIPDIHAQLAAAAAGLGMAWVPCFLGDTAPGVIRVPNVDPMTDFSIWILMHPDLRHSARVRAFVDYFSAWFDRNKTRFVS